MISVGTSLFIALTVAKIFEYFSLKKLDDKFSYWNKKAAQASISGLVGEEIPEEIADNLIKILDSTGLRRSDYDETYRFSQIDGSAYCVLTLAFTVRNFSNKTKFYPFRHAFHKGFLPDYGASLNFGQFKAYDIGTNKVIYEADNMGKEETKDIFFYAKKFKIKPEQSIRIISTTKFNINHYFNFFDSFTQPIHGIRIKLEHDYEKASFGFSSAKFWKDKFVDEYSNTNILGINYSGVVFPGQGIGISIYIHKL